MYDAYLVGFTCLFHAFSAGVCWRARRVAGPCAARCAASCAHRCAASCAARSAGYRNAAGSSFTKKSKTNSHKSLQNFLRFFFLSTNPLRRGALHCELRSLLHMRNFVIVFLEHRTRLIADPALRAAQLAAQRCAQRAAQRAVRGPATRRALQQTPAEKA